jgi:hypothetical protein
MLLFYGVIVSFTHVNFGAYTKDGLCKTDCSMPAYQAIGGRIGPGSKTSGPRTAVFKV